VLHVDIIKPDTHTPHSIISLPIHTRMHKHVFFMEVCAKCNNLYYIVYIICFSSRMKESKTKDSLHKVDKHWSFSLFVTCNTGVVVVVVEQPFFTLILKLISYMLDLKIFYRHVFCTLCQVYCAFCKNPSRHHCIAHLVDITSRHH